MGAQYDDATLILREIYTSEEKLSLVECERPFLTMVKKKDDFPDDTMRVPVVIGRPDVVSTDPGVSYASANPGGTAANSYGAFYGTRSRLLNSCRLDREAIRAATGKSGL